MKSRVTQKKLLFETLEQRQMLTVVINEIHYNSEDNTKAEEFVELHNISNSAVDISGWAFTDGIDYTFAPGTQIPAGGYLVIAEDPATVLEEFGASSIGPFDGRFSNEGENVELRDNLGNIVDEVEYKIGFPWPIASSGGGGSMELINPTLDNNLGGNWRASFVEPLFAENGNTVAAAQSLNDLVHRWSFNGNLEDSVSNADGVLVDPQQIASLTSTQLDVSANSGQQSDQAVFSDGAYLDLPNGIISALGDNATFEWWGTVTRNRDWAEIFSFGRSSAGEDISSGAFDQDYITLIPRAGNGGNNLRITHRDGATFSETFIDDSSSLATNTPQHIAVTWDGQNNTQSLYLNGALIGTSTTTIELSDLDDINNWLGRSNWNDPLFDGRHDEFRIYNRPLNSAEVAASFADGPDAVAEGPVINSFTVDDEEILVGESVTLSWNVTDFTSLSLDNDIGDVTSQTQIVVSPTETTTYQLTATNAEGTSTRIVTVTVNIPRVTPGLTNNAFATNAAPSIRQVKHGQTPTSGTPASVTAKVTDPDGVASVTLQYQIVLPGQYLPATSSVPVDDLISSNGDLEPTLNPEYVNPANWTSVAMVDNGVGGDVVGGDDIYTGVVPAQAHRTLVRYRIVVADMLGNVATVPYEDDASLNFAFFVYDGVPDYRDNSNQIIADSATINELPVYHFITDADELEEVLAYSSADQIPQGSDARFSYNWAGTIVYDGEVYDNIHYRLRGANGRYFGDGKRSMRFRFNDGSYFQAYNQDGVAYPEKWRTLTTGKGFDNHRTLTYSLNEAVTLGLSNLMGLPAADTHWFQFRVIDDAAEAPDQWNGDFWGLNFVTETYDKRFLDAHGLEAGNLYKLINQSRDALRQQRYQAPNAVSDGSDHDYIEDMLGRNSSDIEHRVNLEKYYLFHSLVEMVRHYDFWPSSNKNMVYYFEPDYLPENDNLGKLWLLPWDTDASWGPTWNAGEDVVYDALFNNNDSSYSNALVQPDYYNTLREMRDLIWQPDQIRGFIEELASAILPLESADRARWQGAPSSAGNYDGLGGAGQVSISNLIEDMMKFAFIGGNDWPDFPNGSGFVQSGGRAAYLDDILINSGEEALIPQKPVISYAGVPGFAADGLTFQTTAFSDPQGDSFSAIQWRMSEVTPVSAGLDPNVKFKDEFTASWDSGPLATNATQISPPVADVKVGELHRARVRFQDSTGRWSHWSDPIEFVPTEAASLPSITITELHYHPNNPGLANENDQEFIEILNTGASTVDLSGVQIADFMSTPYVIADGTSLGAGEYFIVSRTPAVFQSVYGTDISLALAGYGPGNLSNGGEMISLLTADGAIIESFNYDDATPWVTTPDGTGPSLEIIDPLGDHSDPTNWRASASADGSPGYDGLSIDLPGDYNADGNVTGTDFLIWQQSFDQTVNPLGSGADGNINGRIDGSDLSVWQNAYRAQTPLLSALSMEKSYSHAASSQSVSIEASEFTLTFDIVAIFARGNRAKSTDSYEQEAAHDEVFRSDDRVSPLSDSYYRSLRMDLARDSREQSIDLAVGEEEETSWAQVDLADAAFSTAMPED